VQQIYDFQNLNHSHRKRGRGKGGVGSAKTRYLDWVDAVITNTKDGGKESGKGFVERKYGNKSIVWYGFYCQSQGPPSDCP